nr:hypothetical protein [Leuven Partiti-like virus 2]
MTYALQKSCGFGQRLFKTVNPSPYLNQLIDPNLGLARSTVTIQAIRNDVLKFGNSTKYDFANDGYMTMAVNAAYRAFMLPHPVRMIHLNDVFTLDLPIWKSSPGLPWREYGYKTKGELRHDVDAIRQIRKFWHIIKRGDKMHPPDCCAYVRSHVTDIGESKIRAVWGYPATLTLGEAVFAIPLIDAYRKCGTPIAYGYETALGGMKKLYKEAHGKYFVAIDFSSFDKNVPKYLIDVAFDIFLRNLDLSYYRDHGVASADRMQIMYNYIRNYFINTPIRLCNGERYKKTSGVASGSYFTQLVDSVVNYILITWLTLKCKASIDWIKVMGDDSIFGTDTLIDLDDFQDLAHLLGMEINIKKSAVSKYLSNLTFLGYQINDGIPSRPLETWMASLLYPEHPDRNWDDVASRALGLLYANAAVTQKFDGLCRMIVSLRPYDLNVSRGMARYLFMQGIYHLEKEPPDMFYFMSRLHI